LDSSAQAERPADATRRIRWGHPCAGPDWRNAQRIVAVGFIGLFGIAVQNGLVLIAQTRALIQEGLSFGDALRQASIGRVRPKLMTQLRDAWIAPAGSSAGQGGELERPLAIVMIGGLVASTLFTLLALPTFFSLVHGLLTRWRRQPIA
jgi:heavy metal efflux system protein